ncbi:uncharacterized protein LOC131679884 [Topomyia yanbarensis]|uniref:uncharacterized protein LOC131679884 n=1 Tax=Topomyia yanbarensis TaxID=2498891 RepID=UPI00273AE553|nr:uncharacterized protein LOC131679884 [Topomyia yanbarensis]
MPRKRPQLHPESSCALCQSEDNSRMVCCDQCHKWYHFDCVEVTEDVADHEWSCTNCVNPTPDGLVPPVPIPATVPIAPGISSQLPLDLQLKLLEEERAIERKFLQRKYQLMMEASGLGYNRPSTSQFTTDYSFRPPANHSSPLAPVPPTAPELNLLEGTGVANETALLNSSQIAARHAVAKELPIYSGEPEEWPLFFATYENTTRLCGYTPEENIVRLQRCLRGKAMEAVKCQLLHPANLQYVLSTLKMLFGRPEIIVHTLIEKLNRIPTPKADKLNTLVDFALAVRNMVATVKACNLEEHLCNITLLQGLVERLPPMVKLNWATYRMQLARISLLEFSDWLYTVAEAASAVTMPSVSTAPDSKYRRGSHKEDGFLNVHTEQSSAPRYVEEWRNGCLICRESCSGVEKCRKFLELDHPGRWAALRDNKLCRTCLGSHRGLCRSGKICGQNGCTFKHHFLLHNNHNDKSVNSGRYSSRLNKIGNATTNATTSQYNFNTHKGNETSVMFQYIPVALHHQGRTIHTHAFIDCGSQMTLIEKDLATELDLRGEKHPLCIRWTSDHCRFEDSAERVSLQVSGTKNNYKFTISDVFTVKDLKLPTQSLSVAKMCEKYTYLRGLPVESYDRVHPRLLIGMNNIRLGHALDSREGKENEPIATKTRLGWTIYGTFSNDDRKLSTAPYSFHICSHFHETEDDLHTVVKNFFALDSLGISAPLKESLSAADKRAMEILRSNTIIRNGRYCTSLLWKYDDVRLPNNKAMALRRHHCLVKRMKREPTLGEMLKMKIAGYVQRGYIRKLSSEEKRVSGNRVWYLPIFPVFNPNKPGKVRLVWDAAASMGGISLNSVLLKGPDQLRPLPSVLYQFREHSVAICGDIEEMFHQVEVNEDDQQSQRFLFHDTDVDEPDEYIMKVITFGASCSPSSAQFIINKNAERFKEQLPVAVGAIRNNHYVDDMLASVNTEEEAIQLAKDVHFIHEQGGFKMRGWISNSPNVMKALSSGDVPEKSMDVTSDIALEKVLGMWWNTESDDFRFKLSKERHADLLFGTKHPTKREVLSVLMSIYDPLGLIANFLMPLKLLLQEVWRSGVTWDEPIESRQLQKWKAWLCYLPQASSVRIPRCYISRSTGNEMMIELHTFVDASELGYCAVSYLRFEQEDRIECALVGAKTRVAPLKFVSIPRLELQAAVIGTRFAKSIQEGHSIEIVRRFFWTDAADVLCWLRSDHRTYSPFVAFRVSEILESTDISEWRYVPTKENVADEGTKWHRHPKFDAESRWRRASSFLRRHKEEWPVEPSRQKSTTLELRTSLLHHTVVPIRDFLPQYLFSSWRRLLRVTALVLRFPANIRRRRANKTPLTGPLTQEELLRAEMFNYKRAQQDVYANELALLNATKPMQGMSVLPKRCALYKLNPSIDNEGVMRIHSRIDACDYADSFTKYPIVLPRGHALTKLVLQEIHEKYHHQCIETFVNETRKKFYIPKVRMECKKIRSDCQRCKIRRAQPIPPAMGDLPEARLAAFVRPFSYIGIDYFGPLQVAVGRRVEKRWGVLVTCLTIRAIHIELAHSLNTDSCIMALRNCFARRGVPIQIMSDRGTNFIGSEKELKKALAAVDQDKIMKEFTSPTTSWVFNPPASPHMGGAWERLIQSVKKILAEMQPTRLPRDEVLRNSLIEVENIVNSRPLTHVSIDYESSPALTPNHFLVNSSNGLKPLVPFDDHVVALKQSYKTSQLLANIFWRRWVNEYLPTITRRTKWFSPAKPISVGDIVVVVDSNLPRNCWPKGRVIETVLSKDGQVRQATVQTIGGIYQRPAVNIAVLDVGANAGNPDQGPATGGGVLSKPLVRSAPRCSAPWSVNGQQLVAEGTLSVGRKPH